MKRALSRSLLCASILARAGAAVATPYAAPPAVPYNRSNKLAATDAADTEATAKNATAENVDVA